MNFRFTEFSEVHLVPVQHPRALPTFFEDSNPAQKRLQYPWTKTIPKAPEHWRLREREEASGNDEPVVPHAAPADENERKVERAIAWVALALWAVIVLLAALPPS